jgi:hypothetical protein
MAGLLTIAVATAAEPTVMQPEAAEGGDPGQHCAAVVEPVRKGQEASKVTEIGCFASFPQAIAAATGGEVQLPGSATPESVDGTNVNTEAVRLIGIDYDSRSYRGRSFSWFASNAFGCLGGRFYRATYLGKSFDNKLTSTRGFGFCSRNDSFTGYFQNGFFGRCFPNCTYIGNFLNNTTSSKRWLP